MTRSFSRVLFMSDKLLQRREILPRERETPRAATAALKTFICWAVNEPGTETSYIGFALTLVWLRTRYNLKELNSID